MYGLILKKKSFFLTILKSGNLLQFLHELCLSLGLNGSNVPTFIIVEIM